jgi:hypothetical protein
MNQNPFTQSQELASGENLEITDLICVDGVAMFGSVRDGTAYSYAFSSNSWTEERIGDSNSVGALDLVPSATNSHAYVYDKDDGRTYLYDRGMSGWPSTGNPLENPTITWDYRGFGGMDSSYLKDEDDNTWGIQEEIYQDSSFVYLKKWSSTGAELGRWQLQRASQPSGFNPLRQSSLSYTRGSFLATYANRSARCWFMANIDPDTGWIEKRSFLDYPQIPGGEVPVRSVKNRDNTAVVVQRELEYYRLAQPGKRGVFQTRLYDQMVTGGANDVDAWEIGARFQINFARPGRPSNSIDFQTVSDEAQPTHLALLAIENRVEVTPLDILPPGLNFAQFGDGGGFFSQIVVYYQGSGEVGFELLITDQSGDPIPFEVQGGTLVIPGTTYDGRYVGTIPASGRLTLQTDGQGDLVIGGVRINSDEPLSGVIVFGGPFGLAGVPNSQALFNGFTAPVDTDSSQGINTGVAVLNLEKDSNTLTAELLASDGTVLATAEAIELAGLGQTALFVTEFTWDNTVDLTQFSGQLRVRGVGEFAATMIQLRDSQFATLPVTPLQGGG